MSDVAAGALTEDELRVTSNELRERLTSLSVFSLSSAHFSLYETLDKDDLKRELYDSD